MIITGARWIIAAAVAGLIGSTVAATAQETKPAPEPKPASQNAVPAATGIAVIDVQLILRDSLAMKAVREQIEVQRKSFQAEITSEENKLRKSGQELEKQRAVLSAEAYAQKQREMQQRVSEVQTRVQNRRRQLDQAFSGAANKFQDTLVAVVGEMAKESGYSLVLAKQQVVFVLPNMDVTAMALERLNKRLPTLQVNIPAK